MLTHTPPAGVLIVSFDRARRIPNYRAVAVSASRRVMTLRNGDERLSRLRAVSEDAGDPR